MGTLNDDERTEDDVLKDLFAIARGKVPKGDEKAPPKKLRIRLMGQIYDWNKRGYKGWPGLAGTLEITTLEQAYDLRRAVRLFVDLLRKRGPDATYAMMKKLDKEA